MKQLIASLSILYALLNSADAYTGATLRECEAAYGKVQHEASVDAEKVYGFSPVEGEFRGLIIFVLFTGGKADEVSYKSRRGSPMDDSIIQFLLKANSSPKMAFTKVGYTPDQKRILWGVPDGSCSAALERDKTKFSFMTQGRMLKMAATLAKPIKKTAPIKGGSDGETDAHSGYPVQEIVHRIIDPRFKMVYEITKPPLDDVSGISSSLYVYSQGSDRPAKPLFESPVQIWSAFQSDEGKYLTIHHGSGRYGTMPNIFVATNNKYSLYLGEDEFSKLLLPHVWNAYPKYRDMPFSYYYARLPEVIGGIAYFSASGWLQHPNGNKQDFGAVFGKLDLEKKKISPCKESDLPKSWVRGRPHKENVFGTGFYIGNDIVLTCAHVVKDEKYVIIALGGRATSGKIVKVDKKYDLALIQTEKNPLDLSPLRLSPASLELAQNIQVYSYPLPQIQGYSLKYTKGVISGLYGFQDNPKNFQFTAPVQPGSSGAPVLSSENRVIGVANARLNKLSVLRTTGTIPENVNFAIKLNLVRKFLGDQYAENVNPSNKEIANPSLSVVQIEVPKSRTIKMAANLAFNPNHSKNNEGENTHKGFPDNEGNVPINLIEAKKGLYWEKDNVDGFVRALIFNYGYEHVRSKLVFEWLQSPLDENDNETIIQRKTVIDYGVLSMSDIRMHRDKQGAGFVTVSATNVLNPPYVDRDITIQILSVGKFKVIE